MKTSTLISIIIVLFFSVIALYSFFPKPEKTNYNGYKSLDTRKIIIVSKSIRQGGGNVGRRYSGGGSSYGK